MAINPAYAGDFIKEQTTATGSGDIQLPNVAVLGFSTFGSWYSDGDRFPYAMTNLAGKWEVGVGTLNATAHTVARQVLFTSNGDATPINWVGESPYVYPAVTSFGSGLGVQQHRVNQSIAPTATHDITFDFDVGSFWIRSNGEVYICLDPTDSAAVWVQINKFDATMTAGGTTGAQTINKIAGSVNFAASATSLVVTNSTVSTSSIVLCQIMTNDSTMTSVQVVVSAGSFTIYANAAATAETKVAFVVYN